MKAQDLRIGNKIIFAGNETDCEIWDINTLFKMEAMKADSSIYEPIELTEEWLIRFGFYRRGDDFFVKINKSWFFRVFEFKQTFCFELSNWKIIELPYVHLLQNLFFAVTKKELCMQKKQCKL